MRIFILFILAMSSISAFSDSKKNELIRKKEQSLGRSLYFYYINFSAFHGNGEVIWLAADGTLFVQKKANPQDMDRLYRLKLSTPVFNKIRTAISNSEADSLKTVDRTGIPDEVLVKSGFRDSKGVLRIFSIWESDWYKQPRKIRELREISRVLLQAATQTQPINEKKSENGDFRIETPDDFSSDEMKSVLK